jgi:hypothetical protein
VKKIPPPSMPYVDAAFHALTAFGGDLTRPTAAALLPMWRFVDELTADEVTAVLERFPAPQRRIEADDEDVNPTHPLPPTTHEPGGGWISGPMIGGGE